MDDPFISPLTSYIGNIRERNLRGSTEPGVITYETRDALEEAAQCLERAGYFRAHSWLGALNCFNLSLPTFMVLTPEISEELGNLLAQYCRGATHIAIMDSSGKIRHAYLEPRAPELLLLVGPKLVRNNEETKH